MSPSSLPPSSDNHALVAGASLAGLLAGRVLSDFFERVTVLDHDDLPDGPEPRRGVGQAHHSHVLLGAGAEAYEELFPGLADELSTQGAGFANSAGDFRWFQHGQWKPRFEASVRMFWCERSRLEWAVRRRLCERSNVEVLGGKKVVGLASSERGDRIEGLEVQAGGDHSEIWPAELVVDATGRGTRTPAHLEALGYERPSVRTCEVGLGYTSCKFGRPETYDGSWKTLAIFPEPPGSRKMGVMYPIDEDRFHVTLGGWVGDHAPTDLDGFLDFARRLEQPDLYEHLQTAEPRSRPRVFKVPEARWRRYDRMERWPEGLLVLGDAICNFNPVYGQGMTVCGLEARSLQELMRRRVRAGRPRVDRALGRDFQKRAARLIATPWMIASSQDYQFPGIDGGHWAYDILGELADHLIDLSGRRPDIHEAFLEVLTLQSHPLSLLHPRVSLPLLGEIATQRLAS